MSLLSDKVKLKITHKVVFLKLDSKRPTVTIKLFNNRIKVANIFLETHNEEFLL